MTTNPNCVKKKNTTHLSSSEGILGTVVFGFYRTNKIKLEWSDNRIFSFPTQQFTENTVMPLKYCVNVVQWARFLKTGGGEDSPYRAHSEETQTCINVNLSSLHKTLQAETAAVRTSFVVFSTTGFYVPQPFCCYKCAVFSSGQIRPDCWRCTRCWIFILWFCGCSYLSNRQKRKHDR